MTNGGISRRELLRLAGVGGGALGLAALLGACTSDGDGGSGSAAPPGSLQALQANAVQLSLLGAQSQLQVGESLFTFGLATADNKLVAGGTPAVWAATDDASKALGPFPTRWFELTAYDKTKDESPRSELTGFYGAQVELPKAGNWLVAASLELNGGRAVGRGAVPVLDKAPAAVGSKARSVRTPVATTTAARMKICTRKPEPCPLHAVSLDDALRAGRPTVVNFATPQLCSSRMCGPVVDEQMVVADRLGRRASFIHVEIYPDRDPAKPAPALTAYGFETEPWLLVVDSGGVIRARFEGPVTAAQIEAALRPLLA